MKIMKRLIIIQLFFCSAHGEYYFQKYAPKLTEKQAGVFKMCIGSLLMIYGGAQFGLSMPLLEPVSYPRLSHMTKGGIFAGSGFALFESGFSNLIGEKNPLLEHRSII